MRSSFSIALVLFSFLSLNSQELIQNGGFEQGPDSSSIAFIQWVDNDCQFAAPTKGPNFWEPFGFSGPSRFIEGDIFPCPAFFDTAHTGKAWIVAGGLNGGRTFLATAMQKGALYRLSYYANQSYYGPQNKPARVQFRFNKNGNIISSKTVSAKAWTYFDTTFIAQSASDQMEVWGFDPYINGVNYYAMASLDDVSLTLLSPAGISESSLLNGISVFPNPVEAKFSFGPDVPAGLHFILYNQTGSLVLSGNIDAGEELEISELNSGFYYYLLESKEGDRLTGKLIKK